MSLEMMKNRARNLQCALKNMFDMPVKLSQAYELIAQEEGFKNWDVACAKLEPKPVLPVTPQAPSRFMDVFTYIKNPHHPEGFSLDRMIQNQPSFGSFLDKLSAAKPVLTVVTGATGSGKSSLSQAILAYVSDAGENSALAEDNGTPKSSMKVRQVTAEPEQVTSFEQAIASAMRSCPDLVFMGEIRTVRQMEVAIEMVMTGTSVITSAVGTRGQTIMRTFLERIPGATESKMLGIVEDLNQLHVHIETGAEEGWAYS